MEKTTPIIGFDRYVELAWSKAAIEIAIGLSEMPALQEVIALTLPGKESQRKAMDVLKRLWLKPFPGLKDFVERGRELYKKNPNASVLALTWGSAIASYSFFGKTAEIAGRLIAIQGDCSIKEIQRRMAEAYGERNGIERSVARVLQSQAAWGAFNRDESNKRIMKLAPVAIIDDELTAWLIEAVLRCTGKPISISSLQALPILFPFSFTQPLVYVISNSANLVLRSEGPSNQSVALRR
jgi:hypothetical protein